MELIDKPTQNLSKYVREKGINMTHIERKTGISRRALRRRLLNETNPRSLKAYEFFLICDFLDIDPKEIAEMRTPEDD